MDSLGNEEMKAVIERNPGLFLKYKIFETGIEKNIEGYLNNLSYLKVKVNNSYEAGYYIETISLTLQIMDHWLRVYFVNSDIDEKRGLEFGKLLKQCKKIGLEDVLYNRLCTFNGDRIKAIHGYVIGLIEYSELKIIANNSIDLYKDVIIYVVNSCGEKVIASELDKNMVGYMVLSPNVLSKILKEG